MIHTITSQSRTIGTASDFTINLEQPLQNIQTVELLSANIPSIGTSEIYYIHIAEFPGRVLPQEVGGRVATYIIHSNDPLLPGRFRSVADFTQKIVCRPPISARQLHISLRNAQGQIYSPIGEWSMVIRTVT